MQINWDGEFKNIIRFSTVGIMYLDEFYNSTSFLLANKWEVCIKRTLRRDKKKLSSNKTSNIHKFTIKYIKFATYVQP